MINTSGRKETSGERGGEKKKINAVNRGHLAGPLQTEEWTKHEQSLMNRSKFLHIKQFVKT